MTDLVKLTIKSIPNTARITLVNKDGLRCTETGINSLYCPKYSKCRVQVRLYGYETKLMLVPLQDKDIEITITLNNNELNVNI